MIRNNGYQKINTINVTKGLYFSIKSCIIYFMKRKLRIESNIKNLRVVENTIDKVTNEIGINQEYYGKILVSTLEAVNNAILHGNNSNPNKFVEIIINFEKKHLIIKVTDEGNGFVPEEIPDPTKLERIEEINGRGVFLMSHLADEIRYSKRGNAVILTFKNVVS